MDIVDGRGKIIDLRVESFAVYKDHAEARLVSNTDGYKYLKIDLDIADFGKTWFMTEEEVR